MSEKKKVGIVIPCVGVVVADMVRLSVAMSRDSRFEVDVRTPQLVPVENNRNHAVLDFLERGEDFLLFIDSDNPPLVNPLDLVELDLPIVGCPTPMFQCTPQHILERIRPIRWNVFDYDASIEKWSSRSGAKGDTDLEEVDAVGSGCILIRRDVLEAVPAPFMRRWDEKGRVVAGSDLDFCRRAKEAGFSTWVNWRYMCEHYNTVRLAHMYDLYQAPQTQKVEVTV